MTREELERKALASEAKYAGKPVGCAVAVLALISWGLAVGLSLIAVSPAILGRGQP